jgi:hypothetical protein
VVDLKTGSERSIARGSGAFPSRDGTRIYFAAAEDDHRLDAVPIGGGEPVAIAHLPAAVVDGVDAADGIHLELGAGPRPLRSHHEPTQAWRLDRGTPVHEDSEGLVFAAASGWRAVRIDREDGMALRLVAPGKPLAEVTFERPIVGRPEWVGDHEIALCSATTCQRVDAATGETLATAPITGDPRNGFAASPDGTRWFSTDFVGHVTRHKVVNFDHRPWKP